MMHNGVEYVALDTGAPQVTFQGYRRHYQGGAIDWRFRLEGMHAGPPIEVWACNVGEVTAGDAEDTWTVVAYDELRWMDDNEVLDDDGLRDAYSDVIQETLGESYEHD